MKVKLTKYPLVSVCIPAYNAEDTLGRTLESVLRQDYEHIEVIVSDNQSSDGTAAVVLNFAAKDKRVRYLLREDSSAWALGMPAYIGAYDNSNNVLAQGRGELLCWFHADDLHEPDIISRQLALMEKHPRMGAVFTTAQYIGDHDEPLAMGTTEIPSELKGREVFTFASLFNAILAHSNFLYPSVMIRKAALEAIGWFNEPEFLTSADLDMWLRIAQRYDIGIIDEPLLKYRVSLKQFGAQYSRLRTTLGDIFRVLDYYLQQPEVQRLVLRDNLAIYEMERAADHVLCAMNLLVQGNTEEARARLQAAVCWRHLVTARKRPRRLARLLVGFCLLSAVYLGAGAPLGLKLYRYYQRDLQRRRTPMPNPASGKFNSKDKV